MYIFAGASKTSQPHEFFEKHGFNMDELPSDFSAWRGDPEDETPCYTTVVQNDFESNVANSDIRVHSIHYLICRWWKKKPNNARLIMKAEKFDKAYNRLTSS